MSLDSPHDLPVFTQNAINLASAGLGAKALSASDEFFAPLERLLNDEPAIFIADKYDDNGKWMDGWETRRKRGPGFDHAIIQLAARGQIFGFDVDTSHFTGNFPPACSIEAANISGDPGADTLWTELLSVSKLDGNAHHYFECEANGIWSHVRIRIYPDGGVARLRVFGQPHLDLAAQASTEIDLAAALNGGRIVSYSNAHYGGLHRLLAPGRGLNMGDGWETSRRRVPGNEWLIVALATCGTISRAIVDTAHFKGNYPDACSMQGANLSKFGNGLDDAITTSSMFWKTLLPQQKLSADTIHEFSREIEATGPVTHIRLNIFPDGGVSRLRLFGKISDP